jgi:2-keto-4-pentenoate hydratase
VEAARRVVSGVFLALKVIDTRFTDWQIGLVDSVADNASCARVVMGPWSRSISAGTSAPSGWS